MEALWAYTLLSLLFSIFCLTFLSKWWRNLPPSPPLALPIIGHLHLLRMPFHGTFHNLSQKYGKIFSLQIGNRRVVVVSSPSAVQECFTKNDIILANRPPVLVSNYLGYNSSYMIGLPYGGRWRDLRRLTAVELFSSIRLNTFWSIRKDEVRRLLLKLAENSRHDFAKVEMKSKFSQLSFNVILRMVTGKPYLGQDEENDHETKSFRELIHEVFEHSGKIYPSDFVQFLGWIDYKNSEKKLAQLRKRMDASLEGLLDRHR